MPVLEHPPNLINQTPCHFIMFLKGRHFESLEDILTKCLQYWEGYHKIIYRDISKHDKYVGKRAEIRPRVI